jgi:endonuclease III
MMALDVEARTKRALVRWCDGRLRQEFGDRVPPRPRPDPLDELVLTVLSQNTNDVNRDRAYAELRRRWPRWEDLLAADVAEIEDAIRGGGLARQKSARIQAMLRGIADREGKLSLERLRELPRAEALAYLYSFKGVGAKTAAIVMLFACGVPVFPVDTHVLRVGKRLGLLPAPADADQAHEIMGALVPDERMYRFHINLIAHGRATCHARKPECGSCCLRMKCPSAFKVK